MKTIAVIPARYGATRLPGKPLREICGKPLIHYVWEAATSSGKIDRVIIATDDGRIFDAAQNFGAEVFMTPAELKSGTDRVAFVIKNFSVGERPNFAINIQGDEPLLTGKILDSLVETIQNTDAPMATIVAPINENFSDNPNVVKVVLDKNNFALYFSRSKIPFNRDTKKEILYWKHIGLYAFKTEALIAFSNFEPTRLENAEKLEQLRALENGFRIKCAIVPDAAKLIGVDTEEDLLRVEKVLRGD